MNTNIEQVVLKNILTNEKYMRKVLPFVKPDYFEGTYKILFKEAGKFVGKYNNCLLYTSPSPRDRPLSRMPSSA